MKLLLNILILIYLAFKVSSQNLVPNPSFEIYQKCPEDLCRSYKSGIVDGWICPTKGTSDYFNACSRFNVSVPNNIMGNMFAHSGNAYIGLLLIEKPDYKNYHRKRPFNYREYAQCKLIEPLIKDSSYLIKFFYCISQYSIYSIGEPQVFLSKTPLKSRRQTNLDLPEEIHVDTSSFDIKSGEWIESLSIYKANGGETYLTIGNFFNDKDINYQKFDVSSIMKTHVKLSIEEGFAYYYIDDVEIVFIKDQSSTSEKN